MNHVCVNASARFGMCVCLTPHAYSHVSQGVVSWLCVHHRRKKLRNGEIGQDASTSSGSKDRALRYLGGLAASINSGFQEAKRKTLQKLVRSLSHSRKAVMRCVRIVSVWHKPSRFLNADVSLFGLQAFHWHSCWIRRSFPLLLTRLRRKCLFSRIHAQGRSKSLDSVKVEDVNLDGTMDEDALNSLAKQEEQSMYQIALQRIATINKAIAERPASSNNGNDASSAAALAALGPSASSSQLLKADSSLEIADSSAVAEGTTPRSGVEAAADPLCGTWPLKSGDTPAYYNQEGYLAEYGSSPQGAVGADPLASTMPYCSQAGIAAVAQPDRLSSSTSDASRPNNLEHIGSSGSLGQEKSVVSLSALGPLSRSELVRAFPRAPSMPHAHAAVHRAEPCSDLDEAEITFPLSRDTDYLGRKERLNA
uniref:Uncharacterized protein n=1 Tax=Chrysotila carterae TaxID=13221 RepID=A0A7S4F8A7_CHRCT